MIITNKGGVHIGFLFPDKPDKKAEKLFSNNPTARSFTFSATRNNKDGSKDKHTEVHYRNGSVMRWDSHKDK